MNHPRRLRPWHAWLAVVVFPILFNAPILCNVLKSDPQLQFSYLQTNVTPGPVAIHSYFDPSVGIVFQPYGRLAAEDLIHGIVPWWDPFEGVGAPLAGEMSPAVFYPLDLLELLPNGQTFLDVVVEFFAGAFALLLARRLGLGLLGATLVAVLFECNGTFAWLGSGWCYPLPLMPLLIYGIELCFAPLVEERIRGSICVALAVAISISAAMIEIAYLDSLLGVSWALFRLARARGMLFREGFARMVFGAALGLLVAAPLIVSFADDLKISYVGSHAGDFDPNPIQPVPLGQLVAPYVLGTEFYHDSGYAGIALAMAGVCGLFGTFRRPLRILLAGWIFLAVGATAGLPFMQQIAVAIPGVRYTAFTRYFDGSWEFALELLVGFFVYDLSNGPVRRLWLRCAAASAIVPITILCFYPPADIVTQALALAGAMTWFWISIAWASIAVACMWIVAAIPAFAKRRSIVVAALVLAEAYVSYTIPMLGFPTQASLELGSVAFLRDHLGLQRFFTLGPIQPSYGSYFQVAELDDQELPVPTIWADYESARLDSQIGQGTLIGAHFDELWRNVENYEAAGVKYVMIFTYNVSDFAAARLPAGTKLVYRDDVAVIFELPDPLPYFTAPGCRIDATERTAATVNCIASSVVTRRELFSPGWTATVDGAAAPIERVSGIFEAVRVPKGKSSIAFSFVPLFMDYGYSACAAGLLSLGYQIVIGLRRRRRGPASMPATARLVEA